MIRFAPLPQTKHATRERKSMNTQCITQLGRSPASPFQAPNNRPVVAKSFAVGFYAALAALLMLSGASRASAQAIRITTAIVRVTVPVGTTNSASITNFINLTAGATNANFDVTLSALPATVSATLTDTNGVTITSATTDTNVVLILSTTNIAQGFYPFSLNCGGFDTNGLPVTNSFPFVLEAAHLWGVTNVLVTNIVGTVTNIFLASSNNWANAASWLGGIPGAADDVVFLDSGAQTNTFTSGIGFTNIGVDVNTTVGSIRFAQSVYTDATTTNSFNHTLRIAPGVTLSVTGSNGFSLLRDYIGDLAAPDHTIRVNVTGTNGTLMVNNATANFSLLLGSAVLHTLSLSNLNTFVGLVNRMGLAEYQLYPNYAGINAALNAGRDTNTYTGHPRQLIANVYLARTNFITAGYKDPDNYNNEYTRGYGMSFLDSEQSSANFLGSTFLYFGLTNSIRAESVCFIRANSQGTVRFNPVFNNSVAVFRGTNGTGRMALFAVSDDGGTNEANSNMKATVDFGSGNGFVDILATNLIVARDRTVISSNQTPNVQGDLTFGRGNVDVNTAILGFQEHSNKVDWTSLYGASAYLNYCQGRLLLTNGGTFRVNGTLTLGYTADNNPVGSAQQYNTYGQITVLSNSTVIASNIVVDGGLNFYDANHRQNSITLTPGSALVVSNSIGAPDPAPNTFDPRGLKLDTLSVNASTLTLFVSAGKTNVYVRNLLTPGVTPSKVKIASLSGVAAYPVQLPLISYEGTASPFMTADVSALGAGFFGYILNNQADNTVDLYITTNAPNNLLWTGSMSSDWDSTTKNWVVIGSGAPTNFTIGDTVTFDDSSSATNVNVVGTVVPGQTGTGVTITNGVNNYTFGGGGTVAGTALHVKMGAGTLTFNATEQGPMRVFGGSVLVSGSGSIGATTLAANSVLNCASSSSQGVNGGITSTGTVLVAGGANVVGPISLQGGKLVNSGTISTSPGGMTIAGGVLITNQENAIINQAFAWDLPPGSTLANFGTINNAVNAANGQNFTCEGLLFGTGTFLDASLGGSLSANGRSVCQGVGLWSPGAAPYNSIGTLTFGSRIDINNFNPGGLNPNGVGTVRIEVDFSNPQTNDLIAADKWNNISAMLLMMTNINPGAGNFALGQSFLVFSNNNGSTFPNTIDTPGYYPWMWPTVPRPGLQWDVSNFRTFGLIGITNSPLVWNGTPGSIWTTNTSNANWKGGIDYNDNQGAVFDDTAAASGPVTVNIVGSVAPLGYSTTTVTNIVVGVSTNVVITTNDPAMSPGLVISNATKDYIFAGAGQIRGMTSLYKTGPGTLSILNSTNNDFNGPVTVDGGTLVISNLAGASLGSAVSANNRNNDLIIDGATLNYVGLTNAGIGGNNAIIVNQGGATIQVSSATNEFTINDKGIFANGSTGGLTKTGPGTLVLTPNVSSYTGGTLVNNGTLRLTAAAAGWGSITLAGTTTLQLTNNFTFTNGMNITGGGTKIVVQGNNSTNISSGTAGWSGNGSVTFANSNQFVFNSGLSNFSGTMSFGTSVGVFTFNNATNSNPCRGSTTATFDLGTGSATLNNLNGSNLTYNLGALSGGANTILAGRNTNSPATPGTTYAIGANGSTTTFSGKITDGVGETVSVVKVGSGSLALNGVNLYTGTTTVSNGTLGGNGVISGPLTVLAGGTLAPGTSVGTFTASNSATLGGNLVMELNRALSPAPSNDLLVVTGTLTPGGALVVTNIGPDILNGSTFKLFNQAISGGVGAFSSVTLPATDPSGNKPYTWDTTGLSANGTIKLVSGGLNTTPTSITTSVSGSTLSLSWPADHTGWSLLSNSVGITATNMWFLVPGSQLTNQEFLNADPTKTNVFFRMSLP